jgi:hypothetical protein
MPRAVPIIAVATALLAIIVILVVTTLRGSGEAGLNIPTENLVQEPGEAAQPIEGRMHTAANGCFHVIVDDVSYLVVWPEGFRQDSAVVIGTDGSRYSGGDELDGSGWLRSVDAVVSAADGPDGYMDAVTGYCAEDGELVAVFESLQPA